MMKLVIVFFFLFLNSAFAFAAAEKLTSMKLNVSYGDKTTVFEIPDSQKLNVLVNGRSKKTLRGNIDSAIKMATAASKEKSNDRNLCSRKYIELTFSLNGAKESKTYGCIDSKTPAAVKLTELSNLMLFM
jgi:hypothetical protein